MVPLHVDAVWPHQRNERRPGRAAAPVVDHALELLPLAPAGPARERKAKRRDCLRAGAPRPPRVQRLPSQAPALDTAAHVALQWSGAAAHAQGTSHLRKRVKVIVCPAQEERAEVVQLLASSLVLVEAVLPAARWEAQAFAHRATISGRARQRLKQPLGLGTRGDVVDPARSELGSKPMR